MHSKRQAINWLATLTLDESGLQKSDGTEYFEKRTGSRVATLNFFNLKDPPAADLPFTYREGLAKFTKFYTFLTTPLTAC